MLTADKVRVLLMFAHSRFKCKMDANITPTVEDKNVQKVIDNAIGYLEKNKLTVDDLNNLPHCYLAGQLTYYYQKCLDEINTNLRDGDEIIESVLGLNILVHLTEHRKALDFNEAKIALEKFKKVSNKKDRVLVVKMMIIAGRLVKCLDSANYALYLKKQKKSKKKRKLK